MNNELIEHRSWWKRNWKWFVTISGIILVSTGIFFSSGMDKITTDLLLAYADKELYQNALVKVKSDKRVTETLGEIKPIDKFAILEGQAQYSNNDKTVKSSIRIIGEKGNAKLDIEADRINNEWNYKKIKVRIKNPPELKQTIEIISVE